MTTGWSILQILAVYRLVRLVTTDVIFARPRVWLMGRWRLLDYWLGCWWCVSVWAAAGAYAAARLAPAWWAATAAILAVSAAVGLLSAAADRWLDGP